MGWMLLNFQIKKLKRQTNDNVNKNLFNGCYTSQLWLQLWDTLFFIRKYHKKEGKKRKGFRLCLNTKGIFSLFSLRLSRVTQLTTFLRGWFFGLASWDIAEQHPVYIKEGKFIHLITISGVNTNWFMAKWYLNTSRKITQF